VRFSSQRLNYLATASEDDPLADFQPPIQKGRVPMSTENSIYFADSTTSIDSFSDYAGTDDIVVIGQINGQCNQQDVLQFESAFQSQGDPSVGDSSDGPFGWDWSSQISDAVAYSAINGFEIVEQLRAEADALDGKRTVRYVDAFGWGYSDVPDEGEQKAKAALNEAANQLEQYLNDLGSDGMCSEPEIQKFWEEANIINGADIVADIIGDFAEIRHIDGLEIVEQLRSKADALDGKREVRYIGFSGYSYTSVPDEGELKEKAILIESANQLEQYLKDLGNGGMCSEQELQKFWEEAKIHNFADTVAQMRDDAKYLANGFQKEALQQTAAKFEQYVNDLGTDCMFSNQDAEQFYEKFLSEDENPYQASDEIRASVTIGSVTHSDHSWDDISSETTRSCLVVAATGAIATGECINAAVAPNPASIAICIGSLAAYGIAAWACSDGLKDDLPPPPDIHFPSTVTRCHFNPETGEVTGCTPINGEHINNTHESDNDHYGNSTQPGCPCGDGIEECDINPNTDAEENCHCTD
jgi:hypothetical protein